MPMNKKMHKICTLLLPPESSGVCGGYDDDEDNAHYPRTGRYILKFWLERVKETNIRRNATNFCICVMEFACILPQVINIIRMK